MKTIERELAEMRRRFDYVKGRLVPQDNEVWKNSVTGTECHIVSVTAPRFGLLDGEHDRFRVAGEDGEYIVAVNQSSGESFLLSRECPAIDKYVIYINPDKDDCLRAQELGTFLQIFQKVE